MSINTETSQMGPAEVMNDSGFVKLQLTTLIRKRSICLSLFFAQTNT